MTWRAQYTRTFLKEMSRLPNKLYDLAHGRIQSTTPLPLFPRANLSP
jgi:NADH:ubiquinone oxidoreductase subunit D